MNTIAVVAGYSDSLIRFRSELLEAMIDRGCKVWACAPDKDLNISRLLNNIGVEYCNFFLDRTGLNPFKDIISLINLYHLHRNKSSNLAFHYTIKPVIYGSVSAKLAGVPHIYSLITGLGHIFTGEGLVKCVKRYVVKKLYRFALRFNDKVFFQNPDNLDLFVKEKIVPRNKAVLVNGSGINLTQYRFSNSLSQNKAITFIMIARLIKDKGVVEYIEAANILSKRYDVVKFFLVGWIDSKNPAAIQKAKLDELLNKGSIEFLGKLDDVRPVITESSVFVLPSYYPEGIPRSILEAMAIGRPIITTNTPGCRETVKNNVNGYLIPKRNLNELVKAMEHFVANPSLVKSMGKQSRKIVEEKFDVYQVNKVLLSNMGFI